MVYAREQSKLHGVRKVQASRQIELHWQCYEATDSCFQLSYDALVKFGARSYNSIAILPDITLLQEIIKVRERILHIVPLTKVIPLKLFLDIVPSTSTDITRTLRGCFRGGSVYVSFCFIFF